MNEEINETIKDDTVEVVKDSNIAGIFEGSNGFVIKLAVGAIALVTGTAVLAYKNKEKLKEWNDNRKKLKELKKFEKTNDYKELKEEDYEED